MIRHRVNDNFSAVDLDTLSDVYGINISIAGQDATVILDTESFQLGVNPDYSKAAHYNHILISDDVFPNDMLH